MVEDINSLLLKVAAPRFMQTLLVGVAEFDGAATVFQLGVLRIIFIMLIDPSRSEISGFSFPCKGFYHRRIWMDS